MSLLERIQQASNKIDNIFKEKVINIARKTADNLSDNDKMDLIQYARRKMKNYSPVRAFIEPGYLIRHPLYSPGEFTHSQTAIIFGLGLCCEVAKFGIYALPIYVTVNLLNN